MTYHLSFPDPIRRRLSRLKEKTLAIGMGIQLAGVLRALVDDLTYRPLECGEILYVLHHISTPVKAHVKEYLCVVFAVHEPSKGVMIAQMRMLDDHRFPAGFERILNDI